ncbi:MAG TPA: hypothetical protein VJ461_03380 [Candidatus Nanoarchaeia archaeon]|nr:hypothetical protein [Candidatus Nanoarchaeia archaeon]
MAVIPGIKYLETRAMLIESIRDESTSVLEQEAEDHACYFCNKRIHGKMMILSEKEIIGKRESETNYFIHPDCYEEAKQPPELVKYKIRNPFSPN